VNDQEIEKSALCTKKKMEKLPNGSKEEEKIFLVVFYLIFSPFNVSVLYECDTYHDSN
jgi:hypothetical protein